MRFELEHPEEHDVKAIYGHDEAIGFFVEVQVRDQPQLAYDNTRSGYADLQGALDLLIEAEFFTLVNVADAQQWLRFPTHGEVSDEGTKRAAKVIVKMREAAAK